ncbi:MAG: hypothetical protein DYG89_46810 [Caldilinea sp. CFX5]|nr:hypothetical protein [Caldilinea sp. CFX5]
MLKLFCFGTLRLEVDAAPVTFTPKANALLLYLAVTQRAHSRDLLADLLWSEMNNQQARDNLRYLLPELRRPLRDYLMISTKDIAFNQQAPFWVDVAQVCGVLTSQPDAIATPALQAALDLYQGEFLAGFSVRNAPVFEAWVVQQREALHTLAVQGAYTLAERYWQQAAYQSGLAATQRLLQWEPWHEAGHRLQMQLLVATGQRTAALAHYERCRAILAEELGVAPEAATIALYEQIRTGTFDRLTSLFWQADKVTTNHPVTQSPALLHNLPSNLTSFFGREAEIEQISALLTDARYRLVTLVGEGGSGKTRLALAVAQRLLDSSAVVSVNSPKLVTASASLNGSKIPIPHFPDGVWFVTLGGQSTITNLADQLAVAMAQALSLALSGNQPLFTQLLAYVQNKALLLLFDNAEEFLPEVADLLVQLLQAGSLTKMLVTSRHSLNLQAEVAWPVAGLDLPPADDLPPSALLDYSSIALFAERASHRNAGFQVTAKNQAAIIAICRLVEGLPLAIELAAVLTQQYSCHELTAALQQDYTILATTFRDLPPRHRSIKAMLDHSWRLLTPTEATLLAACAVFPSGFDLAAAMTVTGTSLASLSRLIDQSLLHVRPETTENRRYSLHPLVRQYAAVQLQQQPTSAHQVHSQHCAYYLALLVRQGEVLGHEVTALQTLQRELGNLRAAWAWAIAQSHFAWLQQSSRPLAQFYEMAGFYLEADAAFQQVVDLITRSAAKTAPLSPEQARLLATVQAEQAYFCMRLGQVDKAEALAQAALPVGSACHDAVIEAQSYLVLAQIRNQRQDRAGAHVAAEAAATVARDAVLPALEAQARQRRGVAYFAEDASTAGFSQLQQALTLAQAQGNRYLTANIHGTLGGGYYFVGNFADAYHYLQQAWQGSQAMHLPGTGVVALSWLSSLYIQVGRYELAAETAEQAQKVARQIGRQGIEVDACALLALAKYHQGELATADRYCQSAIALVNAYNLARSASLAYLVQGHLLCAQRQWQAAMLAYTQTRQSYVGRVQPLWHLRAQAGLAYCWFRAGNLAQAIAQIEELLPTLTEGKRGGEMNIYESLLISYEILTATADPRAAELLQWGYGLLQAQAAHFDDDALRHAFLTQVATNRKLVTLLPG